MRRRENKMKVNSRLLPIKLHYFFFMAASGAVLPFLQVMGKQLGVSEVVMGSVTALLPPLYLLAKPLFGVIVDHFSGQRRLIFLLVLAGQTAAYGCLYFLPGNVKGGYLTNAGNETAYANTTTTTAAAAPPCELPQVCPTLFSTLIPSEGTGAANGISQNISTSGFPPLELLANDDLYASPQFWIFVALLCIGTVFFNVANSVSDAITFDILGEGREMAYGAQRVWGTVGYGVSALLAGTAMQWWGPHDGSGVQADYAPALALVVAFGVIDLIVCQRHLQMPLMPRSNRILRDVGALVCRPTVAVFLSFAAICGVLDGFIIYYLFWYLEDLAVSTEHQASVKLLEGLMIGAQSVGETAFFLLSGAILRLLGDSQGRHAHARGLTLALASFALRFAFVSLAPNPWLLLPIEIFMQGPTYALSYTAIVDYAASVSPPGASSTMQGLVAGVDDGLGYAIGSLVGGVLYKYLGGTRSFQVFAGIAAISGVAHHFLYEYHLKHKSSQAAAGAHGRAEYKAPEDAAAATTTAHAASCIL